MDNRRKTGKTVMSIIRGEDRGETPRRGDNRYDRAPKKKSQDPSKTWDLRPSAKETANQDEKGG